MGIIKKIVVISLSLIMTFTFMPVSAYADSSAGSEYGKFSCNLDDNGVLTWTECSGVTDYTVTFNGFGDRFFSETRTYDLKKAIDEYIKWEKEFERSDVYEVAIEARDDDWEIVDTCKIIFEYNSPCKPCYDNINVSIDENGVASWEPLENLMRYTLMIYPGRKYVTFNESSIDLKSTIDLAIKDGSLLSCDKYDFVLTAEDSEYDQLGDARFSYEYKSLETFQNQYDINARVENGELKWNASSDVYYFEYGILGIDDNTTNSTSVNLDFFMENSINYSNYNENGVYRIYLKAYNTDMNVIAVWDTWYEYDYYNPEDEYLSAEIDENGVLTWKELNKIDHYTVVLDTEYNGIKYEIYKGDYLDEGLNLKEIIDYYIRFKELDPENRNFDVYLYATNIYGEELEPWSGNLYYKSSAQITKIQLTFEAQGRVSWDPVKDADHYAIEYNFDRRFEVNGTTADTYEIFKSTGASADAYYIKVLGMTEDGYRMAESESLTFTTLNNEILLLLEDNLQPSSIDGTLHYVPLNGVAYYTIYYNSESFRQRIELSDPPFNIDDYLDYLEKEKGVQFKTNDYLFIDAWDNEGRHIAEGFFKHSRHIHTEEIIQGVNPTCINTGLTEGIKCTTCGKILVEQEVIPALGHDYVDIPGTSIEATCTEPGKTAKMKCSRCGDVKDGEVTPALGHDWGEWTLTKAATCTEAGQESRTCSRDAEHMESREIPALGHTYVTSITPATLDEDGHIDEVCELCGDVRSTTAITHINTVKLSANSYVYNGSAKKPTVTVTDVDGEKLVKDVDYTVTYASGRKAIGKYKVTVNFTGSYAGSKVLTFTIKPPAVKGLKLTTPKSKQLKVSYSKASGGVSYNIWYRVKGTSSWKKTTATGTSKLLKNLKGGKYYQVKVRAYKKVSGTTYYGAWTAIKSIKVKK